MLLDFHFVNVTFNALLKITIWMILTYSITLNTSFNFLAPPPKNIYIYIYIYIYTFSLYPSKRFVVVMVHCSMDARKNSKLIACVITINRAASEVYLNRTRQQKKEEKKNS